MATRPLRADDLDALRVADNVLLVMHDRQCWLNPRLTVRPLASEAPTVEQARLFPRDVSSDASQLINLEREIEVRWDHYGRTDLNIFEETTEVVADVLLHLANDKGLWQTVTDAMRVGDELLVLAQSNPYPQTNSDIVDLGIAVDAMSLKILRDGDLVGFFLLATWTRRAHQREIQVRRRSL